MYTGLAIPSAETLRQMKPNGGGETGALALLLLFLFWGGVGEGLFPPVLSAVLELGKAKEHLLQGDLAHTVVIDTVLLFGCLQSAKHLNSRSKTHTHTPSVLSLMKAEKQYPLPCVYVEKAKSDVK